MTDTTSDTTPIAIATHGSFFKKKRPFAGSNHKSSTQTTPYATAAAAAAAAAERSLLSGSGIGNSNRPSTALRGDYHSSRSHSRRESSISSLTELGSNIRRRSASLRARAGADPPLLMSASSRSPDKTARAASSTGMRPALTVSIAPSRQKSSDTLNAWPERPSTSAAASSSEQRAGRLGFGQNMKREEGLRPPHTTHGLNVSSQNTDLDARPSATNSVASSSSSSSSQHPRIIYQNVHDVASKRISTLDYLRKAHEGRVYWFNTLLFQKSDLAKMPYFEARKLARRATNYLLLGISLPAILDPNSDNAMDYLRAFNAVLSEFETYQNIHPPDGLAGSGLSRTRLPQMFKRSTTGKGRRSTSTTDALSPQDTNDSRSGTSFGSGSSASYTSVPEQELHPGEEYSFLLTPSLPFDPDYFETFATLCDVLIDCYTKVIGLVNSPDLCSPTLGEFFTKADGRVRKILVSGIARELEETTKHGIKTELAGVGKMALGGLM